MRTFLGFTTVIKLLLPLKLIAAWGLPHTVDQEVPSASLIRVVTIVVSLVVVALGHPAPVVTDEGGELGVTIALDGHRVPTVTVNAKVKSY